MTKKILSLIAFVASLAACTEDYKDWVSPQTVAQPETVTFGDGSITSVGVIDLNSVTDENVKVCSCRRNHVGSRPAGILRWPVR